MFQLQLDPLIFQRIASKASKAVETGVRGHEASFFFYLAGWPVKEKKNSPPPFRLTFSAFAEQSALTGHRNVLRL